MWRTPHTRNLRKLGGLSEVKSLVRLTIKLVDATTKAVLPYTHIDVGGIVTTSGLDGSAQFDVDVCKSVVIRIRHVAYRPFSRSFHATEDRPYEITVELEKAVL